LRDNEPVEKIEVSPSDTIVDPRAMMIESIYAPVAEVAVS
jgi:hypothetical protein